VSLTRAERDRFTAMTDQTDPYHPSACLETPPVLFANLHKRFDFDVDLTANERNHLLPRWWGPGHAPEDAVYDNVLTPDCWLAQGQGGFSNPPYGDFIPKILTKALQEREHGFTSVFLLPLRASAWYQQLVLPYYSELWHVKQRVTFWYNDRPKLNSKTGKADPALFDSIVVIYRPHGQPFHARPRVWDYLTNELI
jgi:hypothetical protein